MNWHSPHRKNKRKRRNRKSVFSYKKKNRRQQKRKVYINKPKCKRKRDKSQFFCKQERKDCYRLHKFKRKFNPVIFIYEP